MSNHAETADDFEDEIGRHEDHHEELKLPLDRVNHDRDGAESDANSHSKAPKASMVSAA
jgi:hypothetical protein